MFAIRGAAEVERDSAEAIHAAVRALCAGLSRANGLSPSRIVSAIFTLTPDLSAAFPARAAREEGWGDVPMICAREIPVPGAPPRICRVLLHVRGNGPPRHVYLGGAAALRPELSGTPASHRKRAPARRTVRHPRGRVVRKRR